jgi:hypothetical protein
MLFETSSPLGAFSKTLLESLHWVNSEEYCYVWERLDTRFGLSAFQLTPLGQSTGDSEFLLWRTPHFSEVTGGAMDGERRLAQGHQLNLAEQAATPKLWPTPCAQEDGKSPEAHLAMKARMKGGPRHTVTSLAVAAKLWPTPQAHDSGKGNLVRNGRHGTKHGCRNLNDTIGGSLNPRFVCQLMGFPPDFTKLKNSMRKPETDPTKHCLHCGILMSRRRFGARLEDLTRFNARKYCSISCFMSARPVSGKLPAIRKRAAKFRTTSCEICGTTLNLSAHHKNGDVTVNNAENIQTLCSSCHMKLHHKQWDWKGSTRSSTFPIDHTALKP